MSSYFESCSNKYGKIALFFQKFKGADDELLIVPDEESNGYLALLKQPDIDLVAERYISDTDELLKYIWQSVQSVKFDTEICSHIQFDIPSYRSVVVHSSEANAYMKQVMASQIRSLLDHWAYEVKLSKYQQ